MLYAETQQLQKAAMQVQVASDSENEDEALTLKMLLCGFAGTGKSRVVLRALRDDEKIMIKPADNNLGTAIVDMQWSLSLQVNR